MSSARAASMSLTTRCRPSTEPGAAFVIPFPIVTEQADPGRRHLHDTDLFTGAMIHVEVEADFVGVENLGSVHIRDGKQYEFKLVFHDGVSSSLMASKWSCGG